MNSASSFDKKKRPVRKTLRLKGFDYSQNRMYSVTICTHLRQRLFGEVIMSTNPIALKGKHSPNEISMGLTKVRHASLHAGAHTGAPLQSEMNVGAFPSSAVNTGKLPYADHEELTEHPSLRMNPHHASVGAHPCVRPPHEAIQAADKNEDLSEIIQWFKTMTTNAYIKGVRQGCFAPFHRHVWQRNYYEHIVRNEDDLYESRRYIANNPIRPDLVTKRNRSPKTTDKGDKDEQF